MYNTTLSHATTLFDTMIIFTAIVLSSIAIAFDFALVITLIRHGRFLKRSKKNNSRRIGLLHSINTYIHLIGMLSTLMMMCIRTLFGDLYREKLMKNSGSWDCHVLAYLMSFFGAGVYGSCFLQALYRFWRIIKANKDHFQNLSVHIKLILLQWLITIILLLPTIKRSLYISSDHFCLTPFDDRLTAAYISFISAVLPATGVFIIYIRIVVYMKHNLKTKKQWRRIKRDISTIRRILLLVIIILQTSTAGIILWLATFFYTSLHRLFYRLLRFLIILCMIICSITLLVVSPQLRRALHSRSHKTSKKRVAKRQIPSYTTTDETPPTDILPLA